MISRLRKMTAGELKCKLKPIWIVLNEEQIPIEQQDQQGIVGGTEHVLVIEKGIGQSDGDCNRDALEAYVCHPVLQSA
ncbi:MAG: hypothetical protein ABIK83_03600 [Candidatus Zixiibacteriota bacterium]